MASDDNLVGIMDWDDSQHDYRFRLGRYFESLWHDVLADHRIFPLVESNLTLQGDGRTLGELDLLVGSKQLEHWELAVKLYLCVGDQHRSLMISEKE